MNTLEELPEAGVAEIRDQIAIAQTRLSEARDAETVATAALEEATARRAFNQTTASKQGVARARERLAAAMDERQALESLGRRLADGLSRAQRRDASKARAEWTERANAERRRADSDRIETVRVIDKAIADLEAEDARLAARRRAVDEIQTQAAADGVGLSIRAARLLSDDHRAFKSALETLTYLRDLRANQ